MTINKRGFLGGAAASLGALLTGGCGRPAAAATEEFQIILSEAQWRARLTPAQFAVLRQARTERAGTSPLDRERRQGTFHCAGCELPVYRSSDKFDSGTGWPSFTAAIPGSIATKQETTFFGAQTEVHCRRCGGHLGHVFDDGPAPTGKRFCMNGAALNFVAA
jgi:peptide-methionine (R)-S-oxide reductase